MKGVNGICQADIPKLEALIKKGHTAEEIAAGMLGYKARLETIQSFIDRKPVEVKGKDPVRVAAGKKGAAKRAAIQREQTSEPVAEVSEQTSTEAA